MVVRSAPQYVCQLPLPPVAGLEVAADTIPHQEIDEALALLTLLHRKEFDHLSERGIIKYQSGKPILLWSYGK